VVDYLLQRGDMDPERLDFLGASYGGILGCAVLAHEPRLRCGVLAMVGGNFRKLLGSMARKHRSESKILWPVAAELGAWFIRPFEPLTFVGKVAPRPLLFLNVEVDELINRQCVAELYEAAGEPKEEIWYGGAHNDITEETVRQMMADALAWMARANP
jgi:dienelactone hydrolase